MRKYLVLLCGVFLVVACTKTTPTTICIKNDTIYIDFDNSNEQKVMSYSWKNSIKPYKVTLTKDSSIFIQDLLVSDTSLAYHLAKNDGNLQCKFSIEDEIDTTFNILFSLPSKENSNNISVVGTCAPLFSDFTSKTYAPKIRRWLYKHNLNNESDSIIDRIFEYYSFLEKGRIPIETYYVEGEIPIIISNPNKMLPQYQIISNMEADNYYVVLARDDNELNYLIEDICTNKHNYPSIKSLPNTIKSYRATLESGLYCAFLIGINEDWSHKIIPFGLICIDNYAPEDVSKIISIPNRKEDDFKWLCFRDKINMTIAIKNGQYPVYQGYAHITFGGFEGQGNVLSVPYTFDWGGDVRYIRITNEKTGDWYSILSAPKTIVIDTKKYTAPFSARFNTYLPTGDNYLPVEFEDYRGNVTKTTLIISTHTIRNNPQINIDNTIYNDIN